MITVLLCLAAVSGGTARAQDYGVLSLQDVVGAAQGLLQRGEYSSAIRPLQEAIKRTEKLTDPAKVEICQNCRFQLARAYYKTGDAEAGLSVLEEYIDHEPRKQERMALRMMAQGMFESGNWERIEEVASRLLKMKDLSLDDRLNANLMLGQALFQQGKWEACIAPLTYTTNKSKDPKTKEVTQIMIVRALVEGEKWVELWSWIPRVYSTDARYDITLNLTVMDGAKGCYRQDDTLRAMLLYRMVLPREELVAFSQKRIGKLTAALSADIKVGIDEMQRKERVNEIEQLRKMIETINELPPYEDEVAYRIGHIYHEIKRYFEGYVLFDKLYRKDPISDIGSAAILESVVTLYDLDEVERAEVRIMDYLEKHPSGPSARALMSMMIRDNLRKEIHGKVISLRKYIDALPTTTDPNEVRIEADLHYMLAFGYFMGKDFKESAGQFTTIIENYSTSVLVSDSYYYRGMAHMMQADYKTAVVDFNHYLENFPDESHYSACKFRNAVCLFGSNQVKEAEEAFTAFINEYPDHEFVSEAYSMRGDIEAAKDGQDDPETEDVVEYDPHTLDRALDDYRKAVEVAVKAPQADYAAFQAAKVYKLEYKWQEISDMMDWYMGLRGETADVAEAGFWKGKSQIEMGQLKEAVDAYVDILLDFGDNVHQEGVDKIVGELATIAEQRLDDEARNTLKLKLKFKLTEMEEKTPTLRIRMQLALAYMEDDAELDRLGAELLKTQADLSVVPPIALALMSDAAVLKGDTKKMGELFDYFISNYEESDSLWHAYRAKAHQLHAEDDLTGALAILQEALDFYGADAYMGWAQIMKADILFKMKKLEDARAAYEMVTNVGEWRGPLCGEAYLGMGRCLLAQGNLEDAHIFFQRTYLLYKAYDDGKWAAEGYMAAADTLLEMGLTKEAVNTWRAMQEDEYVKHRPEAEAARELIKKHGDA